MTPVLTAELVPLFQVALEGFVSLQALREFVAFWQRIDPMESTMGEETCF
jgi:hypothetical protein